MFPTTGEAMSKKKTDPAKGSFADAHSPIEGELLARLEALRGVRRDNPAFNPIWQLGSDLSFAIEEGRLARDNLGLFVNALLERSLAERGAWMRAMLTPVGTGENAARLDRLVADMSAGDDLGTFRARWGHPILGAVFTAHPTFLLEASQAARVVAAAMEGVEGAEENPALPGGGALRVDDEHGMAMRAIGKARTAGRVLARAVLAHARSRFPDAWHRLRPRPIDFATWVGYDMDGRTDIDWTHCLRLRLIEKEIRLGWYLDDLGAIRERLGGGPVARALAEVGDRLKAARAHTRQAVALFSAPLEDPPALAAAANWLSDPHEDKLTRIEPLIVALEARIPEIPDADAALDLAVLAAEMASARLGSARVHFRLNATQLENAIRRRFREQIPGDLGSRTALSVLNRLCEEAAPLAVSFAALAVEPTTAVRQFLTIAQICKHIDAEADLRLLIAECERPATVLAAVYFARLFGVAGAIDISPLFETPAALERGERFLEVLLAQPAYRAAVEARRRIAIQTGFSDAGRFIGQIPASLSIERLQANLARLVAASGLGHLECLVFDTHGESMGRGAHQGSIAARLDHVMSPWAEAQFAERGLALVTEVSFQGGDGYLWFATEAMALAFFTRVLEHRARRTEAMAAAREDPFYAMPGLSLDFFRDVMRFQRAVLGLGAYHRTLTAFGLSLLKPTGSRTPRRQFENAGAERADLSKIRAIPHNAILQQLGYPLNVVGGIGAATRPSRDPFADWRRESPRFTQLMDMVVAARRRASLSTLMAYGTLFDGAYWAARPHGPAQEHLTDACLYLAQFFEGDDRFRAAQELGTRLRIDELLLHQFLAATGETEDVLVAPERDFLALMHSVRIALVQELFLLAARIPRFSARNDISREDIMELVFALRVPEAVVLLRQAYPETPPSPADFPIHEPSDYPDAAAPHYGEINRTLIDPMEAIYGRIRAISVAIANIYRAAG